MSGARDLTRPDGEWNHGRVDVGGFDIHFIREGRGGGGLPVFLLHGWPEFWWGWHRNIPALAAHLDVIAPDLRGFGETRAPDDGSPAGPDVHARDILGLADALGLDRFGIVSHDVGA